jgi:hypothetical protein
MCHQRRLLFARIAITLLLALSAVASMIGGHGQARAAADDTVLGPLSDTPAITIQTDGATVLWPGTAQQSDGSYADVLEGARLSDRQPFVIAHTASSGAAAYDVDGDLVVWGDYGAATPGAPSGTVIRAMSLATGSTTVVADFTGEFLTGGPVVWNHWVVWSSQDESTAWIKARDMSQQGEVLTVATGGVSADGLPLVTAPCIDAGWVVWAEGDGHPNNSSYHFAGIAAARVGDAAPPQHLSSAHGVIAWVAAGPPNTAHAVAIADRLPSAPVLDTRDPSADYMYFPATQHYLSYGFKATWEQWGGLPVFGYPLTEEYQAIGADGAAHAAQYLERQRFEWHPENTDTPYDVELGRLGAELLAAQGRDWITFSRADPSAPNYYAATGHAIAPEFAAYWNSHGLEFGDPGVSYREALALFGYPISEPMLETNADGANVLTQYFERAVFEYHPENIGSYTVLLRRVGAEALAARGW